MLGASGHANSNDKALWGKSEYGMTPAQVLKAFPDAHKNPNPDRVALSNSTSKVIIPSKRIFNIDFNISFFFNNTGLVQVTLKSKGTSGSHAQHLTSLLTGKYGKPIEIKENKYYKDVDWYDAPLSISYSWYMDTPEIIIYGHSRYDAMNSL